MLCLQLKCCNQYLLVTCVVYIIIEQNKYMNMCVQLSTIPKPYRPTLLIWDIAACKGFRAAFRPQYSALFFISRLLHSVRVKCRLKVPISTHNLAWGICLTLSASRVPERSLKKVSEILTIFLQGNKIQVSP